MEFIGTMSTVPRTPTPSEVRLAATHLAVLARNRLRRLEWDLLMPADLPRRVRGQCATWQERNPDANGHVAAKNLRIGELIDQASFEGRLSYFCRYVGDCLIEPRYGYVIERPLRLIDLSMPFSEWSNDPRLSHLIGFPSVISVILALAGRRKILYEERVLSLRFYWEDNYFHFLKDVLPRIRMANDYGVPKDIPVVVGRKLAAQKFFQSAFPDGTIDGRRVIFQGDAFVAAKEVVFARPSSDSIDDLDYVADLLGAPTAPHGSRRIFVTRAKPRGRYIVNLHELLPILERYGVEVVDTDRLTVAEQVRLFSSAELVVGIHGAGLVNMIFRRNASCAILEIFPPREPSTWFPRLAKRLEFGYRALYGYTDGPIVHRMQPFKVRPEQFEQRLQGLIRQECRQNLTA